MLQELTKVSFFLYQGTGVAEWGQLVVHASPWNHKERLLHMAGPCMAAVSAGVAWCCGWMV